MLSAAAAGRSGSDHALLTASTRRQLRTHRGVALARSLPPSTPEKRLSEYRSIHAKSSAPSESSKVSKNSDASTQLQSWWLTYTVAGPTSAGSGSGSPLSSSSW